MLHSPKWAIFSLKFYCFLWFPPLLSHAPMSATKDEPEWDTAPSKH